MKPSKLHHYFLVFRRRPDGSLVRAERMATVLCPDAAALKKALRLAELFDRVNWWTWEPERGRLRQRL